MRANQVKLTLFSINFFWISCVYSEPLVEISQGKLEGIIQKARSGRNFSAFLGIPYAEPPINDLRFRSPLPAKSWNGVRAAKKDGSMCPQLNGTLIIGNENCLYLNVFTPLQEFNPTLINETFGENLLPVMFWIHGGAFVGGSSRSDFYNPGYILEKDIILVSINYRLGIFGFLSTGDSVAPGNFGMKDQVLALKWVQKNIRFFGGDPNRVTLFGQSAGGASVSLHAFSDASKGLFHQYITQSGSALDPWAYQKRSYFKPFVKQLSFMIGCKELSSKFLIECLRKKRIDQLLGTSAVFGTVARFAQLTWTPTDEDKSEEAFLTDSPRNLIAQNKVKDCPFITGNVANEGLFMTKLLSSNPIIYNMLRFGLDIVLEYFSCYYLKPKNISRFTNEVKKYYLHKSIFSSKNEFIGGITRFATDAFFLYPEMKLLEILSDKLESPAYLYNFGYQGTENVFRIETNYEDVKVGHTDELGYLFSQKPLRGADSVTSHLMVDLWTSFAINGKPTSELLKNSNHWKPYKDNTSYLKISGSNNNLIPEVTLQHYYFSERMKFWKKNLN